ncbi:MAG: peptidoglycan recognition protein [Actinomycetes bacterium]
MRLRLPLGALFASVLVVPAVIVVPTVTAVRAEPRPVAPALSTVPLHGVDPAALRTETVPSGLAPRLAVGRPAVLTSRLSTDGYQTVAVTWQAVRRPADVLVSLRYRSSRGWSDWVDLGGTDGDTQASGAEASGVLRQGTAPYFTGPADGIQVRVDQRRPGDPLPPDLRIDLIDPGSSPADAQVSAAAPVSSAAAGSTSPDIVTRAEWGADESLRDKHLDMSRTIKVAFVHHTVGTSYYTRAEGPAQVRGLYAYYVNSLGYADIGYNFLVDKYGQIYEGRSGSITEPVRQAATGGFNTDTMAVAAMGNFMDIPASDAMVTSIGRLLGFRLASYYRDPLGQRTLVTEDGPSRFSVGQKVSFDVISGHRQAGYTACPGNHLFLRLPKIRQVAEHWMGANLVDPTVNGSVVPYGGDASVRVRAGVLQQQRWHLTVTRGCTDQVVRRFSGSAAPGSPISVTWHGVDARGLPVPAGQYVLRLTSENPASRSVPWSGRAYLQVGGPPAAPVTSRPRAVAGQFVPVTPTRLATSATGAGLGAPMMLGAGDRVDVPVLGRAGVPSSGVTAVALSVQGSCVSRPTELSVVPAGSPGRAAVVSLRPGQTLRGTAVVGLGTGGAVSVTSSSGAASFALDVTGYWTTAGGARFVAVSPQPVLGGHGGVTVGRTGVTFDVAGVGGVPSGAAAVVLNVRQRSGTAATRLSLRPSDKLSANPVDVAATPGVASASRIVVPVGPQGGVHIFANGQALVSVDVDGYFATGTARSANGYHAVAPRRVTAKRLALGTDDAVNVTVGGQARVPSTGVSAVVLQVTGAAASAPTALTVFPSGLQRPRVPDVLVPRHATRTNLVVVPLGRRDAVRVHNASGRVGLDVAVVGWFG